MGLVQAENIQVHAESYDVALDMSFPKGTGMFVLIQRRFKHAMVRNHSRRAWLVGSPMKKS